MTPENEVKTTDWGKAAIGGLMLLVGAALLIDRQMNFGGFMGYGLADFWPLLLIGMGIARLSNGETVRRQRHGGYWLIGTGIIFLALELGLLGLTWSTAWPLFVIMAGGSIIWRSLGDRREGTREGDDDVRG